ncbi:MAG: hypothetical protein Q9217_003718 [Psora testacea]
MYQCRAAAKREAWYDDGDDQTPNYNPFRKIHKRNKDITSSDGENATRVPTNRSENRIIPSIEMQRRSQNLADQPMPHHANTMPSLSSPTSYPQANGLLGTEAKDMLYDGGRHDKSQDSGTGTSDTAVEAHSADEPFENGPRRRRGLLHTMHMKKHGHDSSRRRTSSGLFQKDTRKYSAGSQLRATLLNSWINILLIFVPIGIAVNYAGIPKVGVFVINFIAIIPLAAMLSYATEEIALRTGETIGGLLNATFGNAVELIVSILALVKGEVDIVQESLIGSMLSNLLLVMGMSFFFGGINRVKQHFNVTVAQTASSLLALAVGSLIIPAAFYSFADGTRMYFFRTYVAVDANAHITEELKGERITELSRGTAILLLIVYACYLLFQLKTHATMYNAPSQKVEKRGKRTEGGDVTKGFANIGAGISATMGGTATQETPVREPEAPKEQPQLSKWVALFTLAASTALVAICAEFMVDSIDAITEGGSVSRTFVGLILLPIVGNAAEHATAVTVACKDKMDLSIGVAVGSSMQIALLVIPFVVVLGWILGNGDMNLAFDGFQIIVLFVSILLVNYLIQDGESHWLEGILLMTLYLIIAVAAWFYPPGKVLVVLGIAQQGLPDLDDPATNNAR